MGPLSEQRPCRRGGMEGNRRTSLKMVVLVQASLTTSIGHLYMYQQESSSSKRSWTTRSLQVHPEEAEPPLCPGKQGPGRPYWFQSLDLSYHDLCERSDK